MEGPQSLTEEDHQEDMVEGVVVADTGEGHIQDHVRDQDPGGAEVVDAHTVEAGHMTVDQEVAAEVALGVGPGHEGHPGHQGQNQGHQKKKHKRIMLTELFSCTRIIYNIKFYACACFRILSNDKRLLSF